jgi:hypothetical protein
MPSTALSWKGLIYYGEVVGFLLAWVAGIVMISQSPDPTVSNAPLDQVAVVEVVGSR